MFVLLTTFLLTISQQDNYKIMSKERHDIFLTHIPDSKDKFLNKIKKNPRLLIYTDYEIPNAYQDFAGALVGIHSPSYNISAAKPEEKYGNPNVEFPWGKPAGTENVSDSNFASFKFLLLPENESIIIKRKYLNGDRFPSFIWDFPKKTIVGEVLQIYYKEQRYTFEVRLRIKENDWKILSYKPFTNLKDFDAFCKFNGTKLYFHEKRITQFHQIFQGDAVTTSLDSIPDELVIRALNRPFENALGQEWYKNSHAATTDSDFHIVPKNYRAATIAIETKSCIRCHESVLKHANDFDSRRDWYGRVRGSDGIFSFHPFDPSCISHSGINQGERIREDFIKNKIVKIEN